MSITRSYNKYTDTYYAYDTSYVWSEKAQKKVQQKKCIGKYDPDTGEIMRISLHNLFRSVCIEYPFRTK